MDNPLRYLVIDFDSFFASVEQHLNPSLRGRPVAVVPTMTNSTSCIAASYEAKALGVKTGTRVGDAKALCPQIALVHAQHTHYVNYHHAFIKAIEHCIPVSKVMSIDEVACHLPLNWRDPDFVENLISKIKESISEQVSPWITCSVGAGPNSFLAKLSSKLKKPNGHVIVQQGDLPHILYEFELSDINGVGKAMLRRLKDKGIYTVRQLCTASESELASIWGSVHGNRMWMGLRGHELSEIPTHTSSLSHGHVMAPEKRVPHRAVTVMNRLLQKAMLRLRDGEYVSSQLILDLRYDCGYRWSMEAKFEETDRSDLLIKACQELWAKRPEPQEPIKKINITFGKLKKHDNVTLSLFAEDDPNRRATDQVIDSLVKRFGKQAAYYGGAHGAMESAPMRIAFNHIPDQRLEE